MYDIPKLIQTFLEVLENMFSYAETSKKHQSETEVIDNKRKISKKEAKQEDLILDMANILKKYMHTFTKTDRLRTRFYLNKIKKLN